jgi:integrase
LAHQYPVRVQKGNIYAAAGRWYLRYYDATGKRQTQQLGKLSEYPTKESIQAVAAPILAKVNDARFGSLGRFILPYDGGPELEHSLRVQRIQRPHIYRISDSWYVRFRNLAGTRESRFLGLTSDYATRESVEPLAFPILLEARKHRYAVSKLGHFVEDIYLPAVHGRIRPSTFKSYVGLWRGISGRCAEWSLRGVRTLDIQNLLDGHAHDNPHLRKASLQHLKHFLSGVFRHAIRLGLFDAMNPATNVLLPCAPEARETYAYGLGEIEAMARVLPELASTIVLTAAFTGLRLGELRAMTWENLDLTAPASYKVTSSIWCGRVTAPKTAKSRATIPIIPQLATRLKDHQARCGNPATGPIFRTDGGAPLELDKFAVREIVPRLKAADIEWKGWHAFRRGIASNLFQLGVGDLVVQRILRHSRVIVTREHYVKIRDPQVEQAMRQLSTAAEHVFRPRLEEPAIAAD